MQFQLNCSYFASLAIQNASSEDSDQTAQMRGFILTITCNSVKLVSFVLKRGLL